jgi:cytochrome c oxidase subunit 3
MENIITSTTQNSAFPEHHYGHHFNSADDEFEAAKQGMWVFLVTEVLMFGGLFVAYAIFRGLYPEMYIEAHKALQLKMGAINTVILITSSLTMALAVSSVQRGRNKRAVALMGTTILLACGFLCVKYIEYSHKFAEGLLPGIHYTNTEITNPKAPLFFSMYFMMTGLHGIHVLIGIGLITWMMIKASRNQVNPNFYTPVELVGFYWHFVDLIWIYLFPLLYLVS